MTKRSLRLIRRARRIPPRRMVLAAHVSPARRHEGPAMGAPHDGVPTMNDIADPDVDARRVLDRLRGGWRPGGRHLADAAVIEKWRLLATPGPYMLVGVLDRRRHVAEPVIALDPGAGWARLTERWL